MSKRSTNLAQDQPGGWYRSIATAKLSGGAVWQYAETRYADILSSLDRVDRKAEWMFSTGLGSAGAIIIAIQEWNLPLSWFGYSLISAGVSLLCALVARYPTSRDFPVSPRAGIEALQRGESAETLFAASLHFAIEGADKTVHQKATWVQWAAVALVVTAALFAGPFAMITSGAVRPPVGHSSP